jgi:hypothetical protein
VQRLLPEVDVLGVGKTLRQVPRLDVDVQLAAIDPTVVLPVTPELLSGLSCPPTVAVLVALVVSAVAAPMIPVPATVAAATRAAPPR